MKKYITKYIGWIIVGLILCWTGCAVGPDYEPPVIETPDQWHQQLEKGFMREGQTPSQWWELLNDPILDELIRDARQSNPTLESAYWNLMQARYSRDVVSGQYFPSVDATGSYKRSRGSDKGLMPLPRNPYEMYSVGFDAVWELDVFGRIKRAAESAQASYEAQVENYRDVLVSLSAEVARNYVELRTVQSRIAYAMKNIELQESMLKLAQTRFDAELVPRLDVEQAILNIANSQSEVPTLRSAERAAANRLCVLAGKNPGELYALLGTSKPIPAPLAGINIQMPAELLRQRPDIRRAERELAAQTAQIGSATADLYPSFSLNGSMGFEALNFSDVSKSGSRRYGFGPSFRWNVFDGDRVRNQIKIEESRTEQLYWHYRTTVLSALEEVENAMTDYVQELDRKEALQRSVTAAKESVQLVTTQYKSGLTDFQNVLVLQRTQFLQEDRLAQSEGQVVQDLIRIYKAMGGWGEEIAAQHGQAEFDRAPQKTNGVNVQESELSK